MLFSEPASYASTLQTSFRVPWGPAKKRSLSGARNGSGEAAADRGGAAPAQGRGRRDAAQRLLQLRARAGAAVRGGRAAGRHPALSQELPARVFPPAVPRVAGGGSGGGAVPGLPLRPLVERADLRATLETRATPAAHAAPRQVEPPGWHPALRVRHRCG
ncbi:unnamed protein product [Phytophthora lilii]|uniref:Unnamed protein product n=1 Tax=Phytophthora lilii TaxID=2077276 RepID=A0A9W6T9S3_9STRA|nr:unnamed protein product [Phytophthora lilii]